MERIFGGLKEGEEVRNIVSYRSSVSEAVQLLRESGETKIKVIRGAYDNDGKRIKKKMFRRARTIVTL